MRLAVLILLPLCISGWAAKLPSMIHIDGQAWAVKLVDKVDSDWQLEGSTECGERTIYVAKGLDPYRRADVILHEVQHAFTCENGLVHNQRYNNDDDPKDKEFDGHRGIYWASPHWHQFIRDNPALMKYIMESDPPPIEIDPLFLPHQFPVPLPH